MATDASSYAVGAVLSQNGRPIAYFSKKLSPAQQKYPTHERELLAIVLAIEEWRVYLYGRHFKVYTDHHTLKYFDTQPHLSLRQSKWQDKLAAYDMEICYTPGKQNQAADALSRRPDMLATILAVHDNDRIHNQIQAAWERHPGLPAEHKLVDGLVYKVTQDIHNIEQWHLALPNAPDDEELNALKRLLIQEHHNPAFCGHLGQDKTLQSLRRLFTWRGISDDVTRFVQTCQICQATKTSNQKPSGLLQPLPVPEVRWEHVSMDLITQLPQSTGGHDCIFVVVDRLSKMIHLMPCKTAISAAELSKLFVDNVFKLHGMPKTIVSDRDPRFTSHFWSAFHKAMGTRLAMSTAFHPQTDGQTERANRSIEQMLRAIVSGPQTDWDEQLAMVEFAYNNSVQASTCQTPFFLNAGQHPNTPIRNALQTVAAERMPAVFNTLKVMDDALNRAKEHLAKAQARQRTFADQHRKESEFQVGEKVWLSTANLRMPSGITRKFAHKRIGPYEILQKISPVAYKLKLPRRLRIHPVFHIGLLAPQKVDPEHPPEPVRPPPLEEFNEPNIYEVERILDQTTQRGVTLYKVAWKGYNPEKEFTWEPKSNFLSEGAKRLLTDFQTARRQRRHNG